jgi:thiamine pyrophosphate-dependent acetolactate synthase large subunit-like protein
MKVAETVGRGLVAAGIDHVFGVVGSGNFHVTNAMIAAGARFIPAAHEGGAASMADGYARVSGRLTALSVHQGPGVTNALTGIVEAAKSRTPLVVLAPEATNPRSNFFVDLPGIAAAIGAGFRRVTAERVATDVAEACRAALAGVGQTVVLGLPLDVQAQAAGQTAPAPPAAVEDEVDDVGMTVPAAIDVLVDALAAARRPVFIAGRGATRGAARARSELTALAERCGALLAVSAAAKGLFAGDPWYLDVSGGFATPLTAELLPQADLIVAWGSTLNMWTTRHGRLIAAGTVVAQVDLNPAAIGVNRAVDVAVCGELAGVARACAAELDRRGAPRSPGWRNPALQARIAAEGRWRTVPYKDETGGGRIDPRTLSIALDDIAAASARVVVDSGNFMGYPSMFLSRAGRGRVLLHPGLPVDRPRPGQRDRRRGRRPDRLTVAALGDGGFLMSAAS